MRDDRENRGAIDTFVQGQLPLSEWLIAGVVRLVETAEAMVRMLAYRGDLYRSRQQLRELSDEHLRDVGLTRRQAEVEAGRPFFET